MKRKGKSIFYAILALGILTNTVSFSQTKEISANDNDTIKSDSSWNNSSENIGVKVTTNNNKNVTIINEKGQTISGKLVGLQLYDDDSSTVTIKNDGIINGKLDITIKNSPGKEPSGDYAVINGENGTIGGENAIIGLAIELSTDYRPRLVNSKFVLKNSGLISGATVGVFVNSVYYDIVNDGIIKATGKTEKEKAVQLMGYSAGNFLNNGTISLDKDSSGTAVYLGAKESNFENKGTIAISSRGKAIDNSGAGNVVNTGKIQILDKMEAEITEEIRKSIFSGLVMDNGMIVDKEGTAIVKKEQIFEGVELTTEAINNNFTMENPKMIGDGVTLTTTNGESIDVKSLNVVGKVNIKNGNPQGVDTAVTLSGTTVNMDIKGSLNIDNKSKLDLKDTVVNDGKIDFAGANSKLVLDGSTINNTIIGNGTANGEITVLGKTNLNGEISSKTLTVGTLVRAEGPKTNILTLSSKSKIDTPTMKIEKDGQIDLTLDKDGGNAFKNSSGVTITGDGIEGNGDILLDVSDLNGEVNTVLLGKNRLENVDVTTNSEVYTASIVNNGTPNYEEAEVALKYNTDLFVGDSALNNLNNAAMSSNILFENRDISVREQQMKNLLYGNIYTKTAKAAYRNGQLVEDTIRGLNNGYELEKWSATGIFIGENYEKDIQVGKDRIDTYGLIGNLAYGLSKDTMFGLTLAGSLQNVESAFGDADGTLIYLGGLLKKEFRNEDNKIEVLGGIGYQYGSYDATNVTGYHSSSDEYDINSVSLFVEGRYNMNIKDIFTLVPKIKFGYSYLSQDDVQDSYLAVSSKDLSLFDAEIGVEFVKGFNLSFGKLDALFGVSYEAVFGDTDESYIGRFVSGNRQYDILGNKVDTDTAKVELGTKITTQNGIFCNISAIGQFGDNVSAYGGKIGIGYSW